MFKGEVPVTQMKFFLDNTEKAQTLGFVDLPRNARVNTGGHRAGEKCKPHLCSISNGRRPIHSCYIFSCSVEHNTPHAPSLCVVFHTSRFHSQLETLKHHKPKYVWGGTLVLSESPPICFLNRW